MKHSKTNIFTPAISAILVTLLVNTSRAQCYAEFAFGLSETKSLVFNPAFGFKFHNVIAQAEIIPLSNDDDPAYFGMRGGYNFQLGDISVQPTIGRYKELYSLDKIDEYRNKWRYLAALKIYYKHWFIQAQKSDISMFTFGLTETIKRTW